jgi:hypothetical protein
MAGCDSTVTLNLTINNSNSGSETVVACDSYDWEADGNTYTESGVYTTILTNMAGCDSTATLNLTINNSNSGSETVVTCDSYDWEADGNTYTESGVYTTILTNVSGCDSTVTLNLTIEVTPTAVATDNGNGSISASSGSSYQWIDCTTEEPINGATSQTFTPTENGSYAVIVTNGAECSDTSDCVVIDNIGIAENISNAEITVIPNPSSGIFTVISTGQIDSKIIVTDASGKVIVIEEMNGFSSQIDLTSFDTGVYFMNIESGKQIVRVIKL